MPETARRTLTDSDKKRLLNQYNAELAKHGIQPYNSFAAARDALKFITQQWGGGTLEKRVQRLKEAQATWTGKVVLSKYNTERQGTVLCLTAKHNPESTTPFVALVKWHNEKSPQFVSCSLLIELAPQPLP